MVLNVYFSHYFITFRKHFWYLFPQKVNNEKKLGTKGRFKKQKGKHAIRYNK